MDIGDMFEESMQSMFDMDGEVDVSEDDIESFDEFTQFHQIDDISADDEGEPLELNFE